MFNIPLSTGFGYTLIVLADTISSIATATVISTVYTHSLLAEAVTVIVAVPGTDTLPISPAIDAPPSSAVAVIVTVVLVVIFFVRKK